MSYKISCMHAQLLSHVQLFASPWTVAHQASLSMGFSRQQDWSGLPFPSPGGLPDPRLEPRCLELKVDSFVAKAFLRGRFIVIPQETIKIFVNTCSSQTSTKTQHDGGLSNSFCSCCLVAQLCAGLHNPMDCSPPGSSVHSISQGRTLEWVAIPFSRGSSQPTD